MIVIAICINMLHHYPRSIIKIDASVLTFLKKIHYIFIFLLRIFFKEFFVLRTAHANLKMTPLR